MEGFIPEKYNEVLGLKEKNLSSVLVLPVGFRAEDDIMTHQKKVRKNIGEIVIDIFLIQPLFLVTFTQNILLYNTYGFSDKKITTC